MPADIRTTQTMRLRRQFLSSVHSEEKEIYFVMLGLRDGLYRFGENLVSRGVLVR